MQLVSGKYVDIVTDMPMDDTIRSLPAVFDAAVPIWCKAFGVELDEVSDWHARAYIMRARERFVRSGLLPNHLPQFPYGFQWGNELWVAEQATAYYHRHLLLHEGTHWFMSRHFGNNGPPWLMEGLAEWYGTHRWDGENLSVGVVPATKQEVPGWGRITVIQQQLADGIAPSLETILRYGGTAHQDAEAYAWSWAAILFLKHHPDSRQAFHELFSQPMRPDQSMTRWYFRRLRTRWPRIRAAWNAVLSDLEYGFDPTQSMVQLSVSPKPIPAVANVQVDAAQTWQATGYRVEPGDAFSIRALGEFVLGETSKPWKSFADGVTIEYYRGNPLGQLTLAVMSPITREPDAANATEITSIGSSTDWTAKAAGEIFLRVNERVGGIKDNRGHLNVEIRRQ
ncbi:MAG: hypothetical protein Aurels2KO_03420 [Aureliella sp.]